MFTRPALYHPYKKAAPSSPAGFRIADYISPKRCFNLFQGPDLTNARSPDPSPLSSPIRGARHPEDDPPPTIRLTDLFADDGLRIPKRPTAPPPDHHRNAIPNTPIQDPLPIPPRRKGKHGPKHLSFGNGANRPGAFFPYRRAQQLKDKRDTARRRVSDHHERRLARAREGINNLRKEAEALMTPDRMNDEDRIFLKQLEALQLDQVMKHDLEQCRQRMSRAADGEAERIQEHEKRDEEAAKMWGECQDEEAEDEQKKKVAEFVQASEDKRDARYRRTEAAALRADEKRRHAHEALERKIREEQERLFRQEMARKVKEQEDERRRQEERERRLQEERERRQREEQERKLREELERLREAHERFLREERERLAREERERQARFLTEQARRVAQDEQASQRFVMYEGKWNELRTSNSLPPIDVREMPWPVFGIVSSVDQITYQDVRTFLFHPKRPGVEGKSARDKVKSEVLRFHPDKFNTRIVPKVQLSQQAVAQEIAGAVARILTKIMTEEAEQQK